MPHQIEPNEYELTDEYTVHDGYATRTERDHRCPHCGGRIQYPDETGLDVASCDTCEREWYTPRVSWRPVPTE